MQSTQLKVLFILIFSLILVSCGGSNDSEQSSVLSGYVRSEAGSYLAKAQVMIMERESNTEVETITGQNGYYEFVVPDGVYDLAVELDGYVTSYFGPIRVKGFSTKELKLISSEGISSDLLFGKLSDADGNPVSNASVVFSSNLADQGETQHATASANAEGWFEMEVSGEMAGDLDFSDNSGGKEFVDIVKLDKPCYVEMSLGAVAQNVFRYDQAEPVSAATLAAERSSNDRPIPEEVFIYEGGYQYVDGILRVGENLRFVTRHSYDYSQLHDTRPKILEHKNPIKLRKNGSWFYTYAVTYHCLGRYAEPGHASPVNGAVSLYFKDQSGDRYNSWTCAFGEKKISYNSDKPNIIEVGEVPRLS